MYEAAQYHHSQRGVSLLVVPMVLLVVSLLAVQKGCWLRNDGSLSIGASWSMQIVQCPRVWVGAVVALPQGHVVPMRAMDDWMRPPRASASCLGVLPSHPGTPGAMMPLM